MRAVRVLVASSVVASLAVAGISVRAAVASSEDDIVAPVGSEAFASHVEVLDNGNFVVSDPGWDSPSATDVGAVRLYDGHDHHLISTLTGSNAGDQIGSAGITVLPNGNLVVLSPLWNNDSIIDAGAATWVDAAAGRNDEVSATNSLVGDREDDLVGTRVTALVNGNYVVSSPAWSDNTHTGVGAATWASRDGSTVGVVSAGDSLVGSNTADAVGFDIVPLTNGNYVVDSPQLGTLNQGSATWGNGTDAGPRTVGPVLLANSLVGSHLDDAVGSAVRALTNGNYVVVTPSWDNVSVKDVGAFTWGNGQATGQRTAGTVTLTNSLIGSSESDGIDATVTALTHGNYVVAMPSWDNGSFANVGSATWSNGNGSTVGTVDIGKSLVGVNSSDQVGTGVTALTNGNYVVETPHWHRGPAITDAGASTWGDGDHGIAGTISDTNSLLGSKMGDGLGGYGIDATTNGNYVVLAPKWDDVSTVDAGAATWGNGLGGTVGFIGAGTSLVGTSPHDGDDGVFAVMLAHGSYVVAVPGWDNNGIVDAGAATFGRADGGAVGPITATRSLVGSSPSDQVGVDVLALDNGNYVVASPNWDGIGATDAGAATWGNGDSGAAGAVTAANSLVGSSPGDEISSADVDILTGGNYVVLSPNWDNGSVPDVGAATWGSGATGISGAVTPANSLIGTTAGDQVGSGGVAGFADGSYAVFSSDTFDSGGVVDAGAVTSAGPGGIHGPLDVHNSVFGLQAGDLTRVGEERIADGSLLVTREPCQIITLFFEDFTAPTFASTPPNITVAANQGATSAVVGYATPAATDDVGTPTVACAPASGSAFPIGATTVTCTATNTEAAIATTSFTVTVTATPAPPPDDYVPLAPARLADTRTGGHTVDGQFAGTGVIGGGTTLALTVAGRGGVPADASAAALNVTVTEPVAPGFVTVFPCGAPQPTASNLNYDVGTTVPNAVISKIGANGRVCIFASQALDLVVDVNGAFPPTTSFVALNPARVIDTRPSGVTVDGGSQRTGAAGAGSITVVPIRGRAGVPGDASAVALNVTITEPAAAGFATVFPCGSEPPTASNLNYTPGLTVPNLVISKIGAGGAVCIFSQSTTQLVADVSGFFPASTQYVALDPARLLDTHATAITVDGLGAGAGQRPVGAITVVHVAGRGGIPEDAATAVLNVTATEPAGAGFVTVYPCGIAPPLASNLNFVAGQTVPNAVISAIGTNGDVCLFNSQPTQLVTDVTGYFP